MGFKSLWPSDAIWWHRSGWTSHYLDQCLLIIKVCCGIHLRTISPEIKTIGFATICSPGVLTWGAAILHLVLRGRQFATNKQVVAEFYRVIYTWWCLEILSMYKGCCICQNCPSMHLQLLILHKNDNSIFRWHFWKVLIVLNRTQLWKPKEGNNVFSFSKYLCHHSV